MYCLFKINILIIHNFTIYIIDQDDADATPFWDGVGGKGQIKDEPSVDRFATVIYL